MHGLMLQDFDWSKQLRYYWVPESEEAKPGSLAEGCSDNAREVETSLINMVSDDCVRNLSMMYCQFGFEP